MDKICGTWTSGGISAPATRLFILGGLCRFHIVLKGLRRILGWAILRHYRLENTPARLVAGEDVRTGGDHDLATGSRVHMQFKK